ncbi:hypothetical protein QTP70_008761 [Hemibagrus guttatus]|uniref:CCHC-type domain-containing protein n=1 Tax=Hemibagrus guttatus TaxID=175788 RepID=A0AAE0QRJ8_9TELE|nr:hypothetical protein QTP70_008761 [Hemibagrus guttatus]KAK3560621.1 hypothetical protein QTP86_012582 [Hemibagrus guttatus]
MKSFECGDIGHKRLTCPHKGYKEEAVTDTMEENRSARPVVNQGTTEHVEFRCFWEHWKTKKNAFENLRQWWDVGKVEIKLLCQQHTANSRTKAKQAIKALESEIMYIESQLTGLHDPNLLRILHQKKKELGSYLHERVKGALVRSRFTTLEDMDAPSAFFFNLERSTAQHRQMVCLRLPDGRVTTDITEMRQHAVDLYSGLYTAEDCDCTEQFTLGLPQIDSESKAVLDSDFTLGELTTAVNQLCSGFDGLPLCVLQPPAGLVQEVQRQLVSFFWSGQHWVRAAVLYLPVQEGGQGLVDIRSRIATFRLQAAQKLLYHSSMSWTDTATVLLRKAGEMGLDKHLFLMNLRETGLANLTPFYRSVLEAWRILSFSRMPDATAGAWLLEEPLFNNHLLNPRVLCSASLCSRLRTSGYTKLGHIVSTGWAAVRERTRIRSQRLLDQLAAETVGLLPAAYQEQYEGGQYEFPSLNISAAVEEWQEDERLILSFTTPELGTFELAGKKALYMICVKVWHAQALAGVPANGFDYNIFVSSDTNIKCFKRGQTGHLARACPERQSDPGVSERPGKEAVELAGVRPAAEGPRAATAPDLKESEPQAQPAAQKPTGATPAPEKPRTAEPAAAEPRSAQPERKKPWSTEKSSVGSGAVLEPPALTEAGTEVQGNRMETPDTTPVQGDGGDVDMVDEPVFKYTLNVTRDIVKSLKALEIEIVELQRLEATGNRGHIEALKSKKAKMNDLLDITAQGALVRSRFKSAAEMDAHSKFFFSLEQKNGQKSSEWSGAQVVEDSFLVGLPKLSERAARELDRELSLKELHEALQRMENGQASGIDGLPAEFYFTEGFLGCHWAGRAGCPTGQYTERACERQTEQVEAAGPKDVLQGVNAGHQQPSRVVPLAQAGMRGSAAKPAGKHCWPCWWTSSGTVYTGFLKSVLHLPKEEGGQGLVQLASRTAAFRLQFLQRILTGPKDLIWRPVAHGLLHKVGGLGLDRTLFLMDTKTLDVSGLLSFYRGLFKIWNCFRKRNKGCGTLHWLLEEPLIHGGRPEPSSPQGS